MEAHLFLKNRKFNVESYGSGNHVKIPGPSIDKPNKWEFGAISYDGMYKHLESEDKELYTSTGMLNMLDRNRSIKEFPQRFQDEKEEFDVVVTCEARVYDQVLESFEEKGSNSFEQVHVCNVEIKDNHEEATMGAHRIVELCEMLEKSEDLENEMEEVLGNFDSKHADDHPPVLHSVCFY
jgi:RNA polymerase II subunit A C-terminal domain phosphatase SSU72